MMFGRFSLALADPVKAHFRRGELLHLAVKKFMALAALLVLCAGYAPAAQQKTAAKTSAKRSAHRHGKRKASWKKKGQQGINSDRAMEIQQALIREKYLTGEATGVWDARTQSALVKYQGDNGWQTKVVPDSRAIIKLGLGPNYSSQTLLNGAPSTTASRSVNAAPNK